MIKVLTFFSKRSILFKVMAILVLTIVFFIGGAFSLLASDFYGILESREIAMENEYSFQLGQVIQERTEFVYNLALSAHGKDGLAGYFGQDISPVSLADRVYAYLQAVTLSNSGITDMIFISREGRAIHSAPSGGGSLSKNYDFLSDELLWERMDDNRFLQAFSDNPSRYLNTDRSDVLSFIVKIFDPDRVNGDNLIGYLVVNFSPDFLYEEIRRTDSVRIGDFALLNHRGETLFLSRDDIMGEVLTDTRFVRKYEWDALTLISYVSPREIRNQLRGSLYRMTLLLLLGFLGCMVSTFLLLRFSSRRLYELLDAFSLVRKGELTIQIPVGPMDEIGQLQKGFNTMCSDLEAYIGRVYRAEILRKDMENKYLLYQINPHFLYNTLEHLRSRALGCRDRTLSRMIGLLGELFRWSSKTGDDIVRMEEELEHVGDYLEIQKLRMGDDLDGDAKACP